MLKKIIAYSVCIMFLLQPAVAASGFRFSPKPSQAHLIQWRSWSSEALAEAKEKNKLILLSLSAVWCHWCHVMDETTYSDERIIAFLDEHFIPVRVDADERPDIDSIYNQGGWPSTVILLPDGEVLKGGNYIPPDEFLALLTKAEELFRTDRAGIQQNVRRFRDARMLESSRVAMMPDESELRSVERLYREAFDKRYGGFGTGQKFPNPLALDFLLSRYAKSKDGELKRIITKTLDSMARGGVYDRVAGGFFRYATKQDWSEPHYEKMLEVNAGLIRNYSEAFLLFGQKNHLRIAGESVRYARKNLYEAESGAFFGSQDADEAYYAKRNRKGIQAPFVDRTVYADSSSLMISSLVSLSGAAGDRSYLATAEKAAGHLLRDLFSEQEGMAHYFRAGKSRQFGHLSDNVLFGEALLDLYNATGGKHYLEAAQRTGSLIMDRYYDGQARQFRSFLHAEITRPATAGMLADMNHNLANYRALSLLGRFLHLTPSRSMQAARDAALMTFSAEYRRHAPQAAAYGTALVWAFEEPVEITIIGDERKAREFLGIANTVSIPVKVVRVLSPTKDAQEIRRLNYPLQEAVYLCTGKRCSAPITEAGKFRQEILNFLSIPAK
jgi:uncharacterized protein